MAQNYHLANQQWARYTYCREAGHLAFLQKAQRCEDYFSGAQWDPGILSELREQKRPGLTINRVLGTLSGIMGEQINLKHEITYKARYGAPSGNADTLTKVFKFIGDKNQLEWKRSEMFADGAITSRGFVDIRMNYDNSVTGDVAITNMNPKNVIPDPDASEYDPDSWNDILVTRWHTPDDIEYMYNKADADALRNKVESSWSMGFDSIDFLRDRFAGPSQVGMYVTDEYKNVARMIRVIERQYRKLDKMTYLINVRTGDRKSVPHSWDRNRIAVETEASHGLIVADDHIGSRIRWTVTADDYVLHDDWSPYKHFTVIPYFPYFRYGRTIGLVENLIDPQDLLNKTTSQELHVINTTANSGYYIRKGALTNMTPDELEQYGAKTGIVIETEGEPLKDIVKIQPNQIPQGLSELSRKGEGYIKTISGRGDAQIGMTRADASGDQIDANNEANDVNLVKAMDNLARTDFFVARNVNDLVQEFYTDPRIMSITHNDLTNEQVEISINWPDPTTGEIVNDISMGEYDVVVTSQKMKDTLEESQFEQAVMLREKLGVQIPDEFLVENSNLINKTGLVKAIKEKSSSDAAVLQEKIKIMAQQLQLANMKAENAREEADAVLKRAKAAHTLAQTQTELAGEPGAQEQAQQELALDKQKHDQEMAQSQQKHEQTMAQDKEKAANELQIKTALAREEANLKRAQATLALRQSAQKPAKAGAPA